MMVSRLPGRSFATLTILAFVFCFFAQAKESPPQYYELRIYHLREHTDGSVIDRYLAQAFIPALHRLGVSSIGVFKPVAEDTVNGSRIYVLIPYASLAKFEKVSGEFQKDQRHRSDGAEYLDAPYNDPPYARMETIFLKAFDLMPSLQTPKLRAKREDRIYELRSYEGPTEKLYETKVKMFNEGNEIGLFRRLNFNAVFYAKVLSGSRMPNLMYMTTFENKPDRDAHWKAFVDDAEWKSLSSMPEYQHTVSKADIFLVRPVAYSDY